MMRYIRADASANTVFDINDTHVGLDGYDLRNQVITLYNGEYI